MWIYERLKKKYRIMRLSDSSQTPQIVFNRVRKKYIHSLIVINIHSLFFGMPDYIIILPSKPKIIKEEGASGVYEIDSLYPGYGHTLGNSLRRIILSSLPGAAVTSVKIEGVNHEFSTIPGIKEDCIALLLNIRKLNFKIARNYFQHVQRLLIYKFKQPDRDTP